MPEDRTRSTIDDSQRAIDRLVEVVQELSQARSIEEITAVVRTAARELTGADGASFVLREGRNCFYADEDAIAPLWKGRRFPMEQCLSGWVMKNARHVTIEDIYVDPRVPADAYRPTFVKSLAMVPIRRQAPLGAIGNYWANRRMPTESEVAILQALADTTAVAIENVQLSSDLQDKLATVRQQEERIAEQSKALQIFTRAMAHDLKEPVRAIRAFSDLLLDDALSARDRNEYLRHVLEAGERMAVLMQAVFTYTQLEEEGGLRREAVDLNDALAVARTALGDLVQQRGGSVTADRLPTVYANRIHAACVLQNLIANGFQHGGGRVHLSATRELSGWTIRVQDDGPGIPPEQVDRIFEPFKRLTHEPARAGLGLATCRKIVEKHGGRIECEPVERGASFSVTLPAVDGEESETVETNDAPASQRVDATTHRAMATVLLVDDLEADLLLSRVKLFGRTGMRCSLLVARDGHEALARITAERENGREIDLVLLDINMPVMDGFEVLERMRSDSSLSTIPVVMCTGSTHEQDFERACALGATGYIHKPPDFQALRSALASVRGLRIVEAGGGASVLVRSA